MTICNAKTGERQAQGGLVIIWQLDSIAVRCLSQPNTILRRKADKTIDRRASPGTRDERLQGNLADSKSGFAQGPTHLSNATYVLAFALGLDATAQILLLTATNLLGLTHAGLGTSTHDYLQHV